MVGKTPFGNGDLIIFYDGHHLLISLKYVHTKNLCNRQALLAEPQREAIERME